MQKETDMNGKKMNMKVSFVVAVYNVGEYVEECVRSLCEQTLEEIEIVIVDDGSTDGSMEKAERVLGLFAERKERAKMVRHEENKGLPQTRWDGIKASSGEYIIVVDGDDYVDRGWQRSCMRRPQRRVPTWWCATIGYIRPRAAE